MMDCTYLHVNAAPWPLELIDVFRKEHPHAGPLYEEARDVVRRCPGVFVGQISTLPSMFDGLRGFEDSYPSTFERVLRSEVGNNFVTVTKALTRKLVEAYAMSPSGATPAALESFLSSHLGKQLFVVQWKRG